jgi:hypothetical protein
MKRLLLIGLALAGVWRGGAGEMDRPWCRHTIDDSSRGADGTRLADVNGDGRLDIVTGWEEGGVTRVYLHPGVARVREKWPAVTVGAAKSVEDAAFVDIDEDGAVDVVSSCEGRRQAMLVHWAPASLTRYLDAEAWRTDEIPGAVNRFRWMFAAPMDVNDDGQVDLLAGGKGAGSELGWWGIPNGSPRDLGGWRWHKLRPMGWLMSLEAADMNGDGRLDVVFTDRKGAKTGAFWLENPGQEADRWREHAIGAQGREAMFLRRVDLDRDGLEDVLIATRPGEITFCRRLDATGTQWSAHAIPIPAGCGQAKAVAAADLDGDGRMEIVFTTEHAERKQGVCRLVSDGAVTGGKWQLRPISGIDGIKHDLVELLDLDEDGDLDVLTCEERRNLGVIWYENPGAR